VKVLAQSYETYRDALRNKIACFNFQTKIRSSLFLARSVLLAEIRLEREHIMKRTSLLRKNVNYVQKSFYRDYEGSGVLQ
jgi:hypothetical protein